MPRSYPPEVRRQVIELARAGTRVKQLAKTFAMSDATIYSWLKQDRIDRGEAEGATTSQQLELAAARRRIKQLETELAVAARSTRSFSRRDCPKRLYPVIASLTGQGIDVNTPAACSASRRRAITRGRAARRAEDAAPDLAGRRDRRRAQGVGGTYGALRVTAELNYGRGISVGHNAVGDIMRQLGIKGLPDGGCRVARSSQGHVAGPVARKFRRDRPTSYG